MAAGLVFRAGQLLIARRHPGDHQGGLWEFPGGKVADDESLEACLHRELKEELGIEVRVLERFETLSHAYPDRKVEIHFFSCAWTRHEPRALDCAEVKWISRQELMDHEFPPADERLLQRLKAEDRLWEAGGTPPPAPNQRPR